MGAANLEPANMGQEVRGGKAVVEAHAEVMLFVVSTPKCKAFDARIALNIVETRGGKEIFERGSLLLRTAWVAAPIVGLRVLEDVRRATSNVQVAEQISFMIRVSRL